MTRDEEKKSHNIKLKSKYCAHTHKNGGSMPKSFKEAISLEKVYFNTLLWGSIYQEMNNVIISF